MKFIEISIAAPRPNQLGGGRAVHTLHNTEYTVVSIYLYIVFRNRFVKAHLIELPHRYETGSA